jgi:hypothetical protein
VSAEEPTPLELREAWRQKWPKALALWSDYLRLSEPRWCVDDKAAQAEQLSGSFAMIRLTDHAVVINLEDVAAQGLGGFALEIMGHEIGHHVYCPADLTDQARLLVRIGRALADHAHEAALVANLYADLLINDRLQRDRELDMAGVYRQLEAVAGSPEPSRLWSFYLRIYEHLWRLPRGSLARGDLSVELEGDAVLGARHLRVYAQDWLKGAGGFALLIYPYLDPPATDGVRAILGGMLDMNGEAGSAPPDGLCEIEEGEGEALHPAEDPALSDAAAPGDPAAAADGSAGDDEANARGRETKGGRKSKKRYRGVAEYGQLLRSLGLIADDAEIAMSYYRERALPHLISFPVQTSPRATELEREGLEVWEIGQPLEAIDWVETVTRSAHVVPGLTTLQPVFGEVPGFEPRQLPENLYLGIDCSGSMPNPRASLSYPILAGTIMALSALRAGARVMACLSGEPGKTIATDGFVPREREVQELLTDYLGTGYSYGVGRLADLAKILGPASRPTHIVILSDTDLFSSLGENNGRNWDLAAKVLGQARGGGTVVLNTMAAYMDHFRRDIDRLSAQGWHVVQLNDWEQLVDFARNFAARTYSRSRGGA